MLQRYAKLKDDVVIKLHILNYDAILNEEGEIDLSIGSNLLAQLNDDVADNFIPCKKVGEEFDGENQGIIASSGYVYNREEAVFKPQRPFASWVFDSESWSWEAPVAKPDDGQKYYWNEDDVAWAVAEEIPEV